MHFFEPGVYSLLSTEGKAACEFPILYYLTACLYKLFGEHEFILRLLNTAIVSFGFFSLFRLLILLIKDIFYSFVFTFLFLSSTILLYYTNNYLPDAPALGFALAGWYYSWLYFLDRAKSCSLLAGFLFFALASLLKVTFCINPASFLMTVIASDIIQGKRILPVLTSNKKILLYFSLTLLMVIAWNAYAILYNARNNDTYFLLNTRAIWDMDKAGISSVFDYISNYWYSKYYYQSTLHFLGILIVLGLVLIRSADRLVLLISSFMGAGSILYFLLFFEQFRNHDYYFIALIPGIVFVVTSAFIAIGKRFPHFIKGWVVRSAILLLCLLSLKYAGEKLSQRYETENDLFSVIGNKLEGTKDYLDEIGVDKDKKVVLVTDLTPNGGLYFIDRCGWNLRDTSELSVQYLRNYIRQGADYILLTDRNYLNSKDLYNNLGRKAGEKNNILVFRTRHSN